MESCLHITFFLFIRNSEVRGVLVPVVPCSTGLEHGNKFVSSNSGELLVGIELGIFGLTVHLKPLTTRLHHDNSIKIKINSFFNALPAII